MTNVVVVPSQFGGAVYTASNTSSVIAPFVGVVSDNAPSPATPPSSSTALPSASARARFDVDDWQPPAMRQFAIAAGSPPPVVVLPFLRARMPYLEGDWFPRRPRTIRFIPPALDDDFIVNILF